MSDLDDLASAVSSTPTYRRRKTSANASASAASQNQSVLKAIVAVVVGLFILGSIATALKSSTPAVALTPAEARAKQIKDSFSAWDGSHAGLEKVIKSAMNDPDSYEHVSTTYIDKGDYLVVSTKFRGKNAFGGKVINSVTAKCDLEGNVVDVIGQRH